MLSLFWIVLWGGLVALVVAATVSLRARVRQRLVTRRPVITDDAIRAIIEVGSLTTDEDEPLDLREIEEEERRFWSESWDEPDEW